MTTPRQLAGANVATARSRRNRPLRQRAITVSSHRFSIGHARAEFSSHAHARENFSIAHPRESRRQDIMALPKRARDPIYNSAGHRANIKHWRAARRPCALCGGAIDYDGPARYPNGTPNPWSLEIDHIVPVAVARARGWTDDLINRLGNTQPAHRRCNNLRGLQLGQRRANTARRRNQAIRAAASAPSSLDKTRDW